MAAAGGALAQNGAGEAAVLDAAPVRAPVTAARYLQPVARYGHGALPGGEWGALELVSGRQVRRFVLPQSLVFEDLAPHLADLDGDGAAEAVVVESDLARGSRLAVWGPEGRIAATPFLGPRHRWLAPLGAADLDGDGRAEFVYVETPHLGRRLKAVRLEEGRPGEGEMGEGGARERRLVPLAEAAGLTIHRFGETAIEGAILDCPAGPVILTADAGWQRVMASRLVAGRFVTRPAGRYAGPASFAAVDCVAAGG